MLKLLKSKSNFKNKKCDKSKKPIEEVNNKLRETCSKKNNR